MMARFISTLIALLLLCISVCAAEGLPFTQIEPEKEYVIQLEEVLQLKPQGNAKRLYIKAQGSANDGEYGYFATLNMPLVWADHTILSLPTVISTTLSACRALIRA